MPKLFLVQACRGKDIVQAAHSTNNLDEDEVDGQELDLRYLNLSPISPVDGDIMICQATTESK